MVRKSVYCPPTSVSPTYAAVCSSLNSHFHLDGDCRAVVDGHLQDNGVQVFVPGLRSIDAYKHCHIKRILDAHCIVEWDWWVDSSGLRLHLYHMRKHSCIELLMLTIPIIACWYFDVHKIYSERFG